MSEDSQVVFPALPSSHRFLNADPETFHAALSGYNLVSCGARREAKNVVNLFLNTPQFLQNSCF